MKFKLLGTEIYISVLFMAVITVMLATDKTGLALPTLFAVAFHETGHLFAMWLTGNSPKSIRLIPASVQIVKGISKKYSNDILIALFGPAGNIALFIAFYINYTAYRNKGVLYCALINLIMGVFNLLPVAGLDGGTVLFSLVAQKWDISKAAITVRIITLVFGVTAVIGAVSLAIRGRVNISAFIVAIYLFVAALIKI